MVLNKILVINGPNLNLLGTREPEIYGKKTLADLEKRVVRFGKKHGIKVTCYQANSEGKIIKRIHESPGVYDAIIYNPAAHAHYSYALRDAVASVDVPVVEVHLSNIQAREPFRRASVIAPVCVAQVTGRGVQGYCDAISILLAARSLKRLGEGFEKRHVDSTIIIAGQHDLAVGGLDAGASLEDLPFERTPVKEAFDNHMPVYLEDKDDLKARAATFETLASAGELSLARINRLRRAMASQDIDAFYVRNTPNIQWLTAFDDLFDTERAHALIITADHAFLHTDGRYAGAARNRAAAISSSIEIYDKPQTHTAFACEKLTDGIRLGIEDDMALSEYRAFVKDLQEKKSALTLVETSHLLMDLRAVKDDDELARLQAAQAITDAAFSHIIRFIEPGMTEREVQIELEDYIRRHGARDVSFSSIVATGANAATPHSIPGNTRLELGHCVVMDFGAQAFGYHADMTRTVFLGEPSDAMRGAWETLQRANETVEAMLRPGVSGKEAHEAAERVLSEGGFGGKMGHGTGHGVGLEVHEHPVLNTRNDKPLVEGNVVTVEPGIYIQGAFGMRLEDCGVITPEGFKPFTQSTHEMVII